MKRLLSLGASFYYIGNCFAIPYIVKKLRGMRMSALQAERFLI